MSTTHPWSHRLALPAVAAPMTGVSSPDLVVATCRNGMIGSFPTHNASTTEELDAWLTRFTRTLTRDDAPVAPNLVVHRSNARRDADLAVLVRHGVELVITSVGSPAPVIDPLHSAGTLVFADVASLDHAWRALDAGADGLVLLTAGAGGQTGWANPFGFVRAVRDRFEGPVVLAGGICDGRAIHAAEVLGADLAYLGTRFIATAESIAAPEYQRAVVDATLDDVVLSSAVGGIPASLLRAWLQRTPGADDGGTDGFAQDRLLANGTAWSAGHGVHAVRGTARVGDVIAGLVAEYREALSMRSE